MLQLDKIKLFFFQDDISCTINPGEVLAILGPSGSGKTSLLKSIKGFYPKEGTILLNNEIIKNNQDYRIGLIHQQPIIFPHWNIEKNLIFGNLLIKKQSHQLINKQLKSIINMFQLNNILKKSIKNLSVGEKQRLAIVRCLMMEPQVILMDEPSSALDPINIKKLLNMINQLKQQGIIIIIASHDLHLIKAISNKIIFLGPDGKILFNDNSEKFWNNKNDYIQNFIN
jgi:ABC-type polar amino acid transport system ATPase subunit